MAYSGYTFKILTPNFSEVRSKFKLERAQHKISMSNETSLLEINKEKVKVTKNTSIELAKLDQKEKIAIAEVPLSVSKAILNRTNGLTHMESDAGKAEILTLEQKAKNKINHEFKLQREAIEEKLQLALEKLDRRIKKINKTEDIEMTNKKEEDDNNNLFGGYHQIT